MWKRISRSAVVQTVDHSQQSWCMRSAVVVGSEVSLNMRAVACVQFPLQRAAGDRHQSVLSVCWTPRGRLHT